MQTDSQQDTHTTLTITLKPQNDHRKAIQNARRAYGMERLNLRMHNAHACYPQEKWPTLCKERSARSPKRMCFRENAEYVTAFSGRTEAPEVRCRLTDRQTDT